MSRRNTEKQTNKNKKLLTILICILAAICLIVGGIYIDTFHGQKRFLSLIGRNDTEAVLGETQERESAESMEVGVGSKASVAVFGKEFMLCTKDGVKYFASMGDQQWSDTFSMTSPTIVQEGEYVAVGDIGGKTVRVYDKEGILYDLQAEGSPIQFALNEAGYLSLITKNESGYRVGVYNPKGTLLTERMEESKGVYPLSSDISDDGKVLAVSYLDTSDIAAVGRVLLFYIDAKDGENYTDSMFAAVDKTDEIIPIISYRKNGTLAALSDHAVYGIGSDGSELWSYSLENTVDQADFGNKEYIVLAMGDSVANQDGEELGTVCWLDYNGKQKGSFATGESVTYLCAAEKGIVIGNERDYTGVTYGGSRNWNDTTISDINGLIPMEKLRRVMAIEKNRIAIFEMTKNEKPAQKQAVDADSTVDTNTENAEDTKDAQGAAADTESTKDVQDAAADTETEQE